MTLTEHRDRRIARTRRLLREALISLLLERGYDGVTVQDVLDRADVGRSTFYAHFRDKADLLASGFEDARGALRAHLDRLADRGHEHDDGAFHPLPGFFEHVGENRAVYRALIGRRGSADALASIRGTLAGIVSEDLTRVVAQTGLAPSVPVDVIAEFVVGAASSLATWWLDVEPPYPAATMDVLFQRLVRAATSAGLTPAE
jgi:AcrR family transcriptional regulator